MIELFYIIGSFILISIGVVVVYYRLTKNLASNNLKRERVAINSNIDKMINQLKQRNDN